MKIGGVTVLYHPQPRFLAHLESYIESLDVLIVIDNSESPQSWVAEQLLQKDKVRYLAPGKNLGIAAALNMAADEALAQACDWLLMMDQDSMFAPGSMACMIAETKRLMALEVSLGMVVPRIRSSVSGQELAGTRTGIKLTEQGLGADRQVEPVLTAWTSGSLLLLAAYRRCGPFMEHLFIDSVDHEYCLRLNSHGCKICRLSQVILLHALGSLSAQRIFGIPVATTNHSALRRYYITRNRLFVAARFRDRYPAFFRLELRAVFTESVKVLLVEPQKLAKLQAMIEGVIDFWTGRGGPRHAKVKLTDGGH